jgi:transposase InsO family protein
MMLSSKAPAWDTMRAESEDTKNLMAQWDTLTVVDDILHRRWLDGKRNTRWLQCVIPFECREDVMQLAHIGLTGGHYGVRKTCQQVQRRAYWKSWRIDTRRFVQQCPQCATFRSGKAPKQGPLQDMQVGSPFERMGIDLTGPWPKSNNKVYILTCIDHYTKWADAIALPNKEAVTVAKALVDVVFCHVGLPLQLISDQGKEFDNNLMAALCTRLGIDKVRTTAYHPASNGSVERLHRSMNSMLAKSVDDNQKNWTEVLPYVMAAYRSAVHESTGYSPNFLHFGREVRAPLDLVLKPEPDDLSINDYVATVQQRLHYADELARNQLNSQTNRRKTYYDLKTTARQFRTNDWVWYFYPRRRTGRSPKWQRMYTGPFLVTDKLSEVNYVIQKSQKADPLVVHVDKLKLCVGMTPKSWLVGAGEVVETITNTQSEDVEHDDAMDSEVVQPASRVRQPPRWLRDYSRQ